MKNNPSAERYELTEDDLKGIQQLMTEKYETWAWNFGFSPNYNFKKAIKIPAGFIEVHLEVLHGIIEKAKIFGDFFASKPIEELEEQLIGQKHEISNLEDILSSVDVKEYFGKVTLEEVLEGFK